MKVSISKGFYLIPVLYMILIGYFLYQYTSKSVEATTFLGPFPVHTIHSDSDSRNALKKVTIEAMGISFLITKDNPIILETEEKKAIDLEPKSFFLEGNHLEINFNDFTLHFTYNKEKQILQLKGTLPAENTLEIRGVWIPFLSDSTININYDESLPAAAYRYQQKSYFISMEEGSDFSKERNYIYLSIEKNESAKITLQDMGDMHADPLKYWFGSGRLADNSELYNDALFTYISQAYTGWKDTRYQGNGLWEFKDGSRKFNETLLTALLAESIQQGEYNNIFSQFNSNAITQNQELTFKSSPFFGNIVNQGKSLQKELTTRYNQVLSRLETADISVLEEPLLLDLIMDYGSAGVIDQLEDLIYHIDPETISLSTLSYVLFFYAQSDTYNAPFDEIFSPLVNAAQNIIMSSVIKTEDAIYIETSPGKVDSLTAVSLGKNMCRAGEKMQNELLIQLGQWIILHILQMGDSEGFLPAVLAIQNDSIIEQEGWIAPEEIYSLLHENPFYPHFTSLRTLLEPNAWVWSSAKVTDINFSGDALGITFSFPSGSANHFIINHLPSFYRTEFFGIRWKSDSGFQYYTSGWVFDKNTRTFFGKITHKQDEETILFDF